MNGWWVRWCAVGVIVALLALAAQRTAHATWQSLSGGPLPAFASSFDYQISPDSKYVAYIAEANAAGVDELFLTPITGGTPRRLNPPLVQGGDVTRFAFTPDSTGIIYLADQEVDNRVEMYGVAVAGGPAVKVSPALVSGGNVQSFLIDGKNQKIVYLADQQTNDVFELWSVPIAPGLSVNLSGSLVSGGDVGPYRLDPLSNRVVFSADAFINNTFELFSVPVAGGARVKLNDTLQLQGGGDSGLSSEWAIDPVIPVVVFNQRTSSAPRGQICSVATAGASDGQPCRLLSNGGTEKLQLNFNLLTEQRIHDFRISPSGDRVVFNVATKLPMTSTNSFKGALYSTLIGSGGAVNLTEPSDPYFGVDSFQFTPDGSRVVYNFQKNAASPVRLESSNVQSGVRATLFTPGASDTPAAFIRLSNDSQWVVYITGASTPYRLFAVPPGGGSSVNHGTSGAPIIFPDSSRIVYPFVSGAENRSELHSAQIFGGGVRDLSGMDFGGYVSDAGVSLDSKYIVFEFQGQDGRYDLRVSDGTPAQPTPTATLTPTVTSTVTPTPTRTVTATATPTPTRTVTATATPSPTSTTPPGSTPTPTAPPGSSPSPTATLPPGLAVHQLVPGAFLNRPLDH